MKKGQNYNHPQKGSIIRVDPIKNLDLVKMVREHLKSDPQKQGIFIVGTNTNLRAIDIARIESASVAYLKAFDVLKIREKKTGKYRDVILNPPCIKAIRKMLLTRGNHEGHLFQNSKGGPITTIYINQFIKRACKEVGLQGNFGSHTMRKTWGYHQYRTFGARLEDLMWCFNHSRPSQTMDYLCLSVEEVGKVYQNEI